MFTKYSKGLPPQLQPGNYLFKTIHSVCYFYEPIIWALPRIASYNCKPSSDPACVKNTLWWITARTSRLSRVRFALKTEYYLQVKHRKTPLREECRFPQGVFSTSLASSVLKTHFLSPTYLEDPWCGNFRRFPKQVISWKIWLSLLRQMI